MRLATYVSPGDGEEYIGIVMEHPATGDEWVFEHEASERLLQLY